MPRLHILLTVWSLAFAAVTARASEFPENWTWDDAKQRAAHSAIEGKPMPALNLTEWINGEVKEADMKGKVVVLDFYATWCGPCIAGIPKNNSLLTKYKDKGLVFVGVCTSANGQEKMAAQAKEKDIQYPIARDPKLEAQKAWAVSYYPTYAIVDRKGIVRAIGLQPQFLEQAIQKVLAEDAAAEKKAG